MKKALSILAILSCTSLSLTAQISGPTNAATGSSQTYSYSSGGFVFSPQWYLNQNLGNFTAQWQSGTDYYVTISWHTAGTETVVFFDGPSPLGSLPVNITQALPPVPTATSATTISTSSFTANWSNVTTADSYRLDVSTNSSFSSLSLNTLSFFAS